MASPGPLEPVIPVQVRAPQLKLHRWLAMDEIEAMGYSAVGRKYGVSDNAVRKWVRFYERQIKREEAERAMPPEET